MDILGSEDNADLQKVYKQQLLQEKRDDAAEDQALAKSAYVTSTTDMPSEFATHSSPFGAKWGAFALIAIALGLLFFFVAIFFLPGEAGTRAGYFAPGDNCSFITCPAGAIGPQGVRFFCFVFII